MLRLNTVSFRPSYVNFKANQDNKDDKNKVDQKNEIDDFIKNSNNQDEEYFEYTVDMIKRDAKDAIEHHSKRTKRNLNVAYSLLLGSCLAMVAKLGNDIEQCQQILKECVPTEANLEQFNKFLDSFEKTSDSKPVDFQVSSVLYRDFAEFKNIENDNTTVKFSLDDYNVELSMNKDSNDVNKVFGNASIYSVDDNQLMINKPYVIEFSKDKPSDFTFTLISDSENEEDKTLHINRSNDGSLNLMVDGKKVILNKNNIEKYSALSEKFYFCNKAKEDKSNMIVFQVILAGLVTFLTLKKNQDIDAELKDLSDKIDKL